MNELSVQQLASFLAAARALHFTRAAASLGMAQPTLSLIIQQLEENLGTPLFDRVGRSVRLTAAGELFVPHAQRVIDDLTRARQAIADLSGLQTGTLRIGATHILAAALLPDLIARFHRQHPGIALKIEKLASRIVEARLLAGELDIGMTFDPPDAPELLTTRLFEERVVLALPRAHELAGRKSIRFKELAGLPLAVTTPDFATRRLLDATAAAAGVRLTFALEFNDIDLLLATLARGKIATVLARGAIGKAGLALVPITEPTLIRTAMMLWHRDRYRTAAARKVAELVLAAVKEQR